MATGKLVQIWRSPGFKKEFFPFELVRTFADCDDKVTALEWSPDSIYVLAGSKDLTARIFCMKKFKLRGIKIKPFMFLGHRDTVVGVFFGVDKKTSKVCRVYTIARDGYMFVWGLSGDDDQSDGMDVSNEVPSPGTPERDGQGNVEGDDSIVVKKRKGYEGKDGELDKEGGYLLNRKWELLKKESFGQPSMKVTACDYHRGLDMLVVGFSKGVFALYQMPDFVCIHRLSISREKITTAVFNELGNWLTFGCAKLGQLLVWEWRSESYILKQQGHYFDVNCVAYSPDSQLLATGADDNKVKVNEFIEHEALLFEDNVCLALRR